MALKKKITIQKKAVFNDIDTKEETLEIEPVIDGEMVGIHNHQDQWLDHQQPIEVPKQPKVQTVDK